MKVVQPRAIAYAAVQVGFTNDNGLVHLVHWQRCSQLHFALLSLSQWSIEDEHFNHEDFYYQIVDYLESEESEDQKAAVQDLLLWWNK